MSTEDFDMNQYMCFQKENENHCPEDKYFTREKTLKLLELYKKYKKRLGTYEVKSMKKLWEVVAQDMSNHFRITIPPNKCENRFKVLERNYKKVVDNNNGTGRGRMRSFEFESEMDDIFEKKKNIRPTVLLSSSGIHKEPTVQPSSFPEDSIPCISISEEQDQLVKEGPSCSISSASPNAPLKDAENTSCNQAKRKRVSSLTYKKRNDILLELKKDLRSFYDRKDKREEEKLEIAKKRLEEKQKRNGLMKDYLEFLKSGKNNDE